MKRKEKEMLTWLIPIVGLICLVAFIIGVVASILFAFQRLQCRYQVEAEESPKEIKPYSKNKKG